MFSNVETFVFFLRNLSSVVDVFAILIAVSWENKEVIFDATHFYIANLYGGVEDANLDADASRVVSLLV